MSAKRGNKAFWGGLIIMLALIVASLAAPALSPFPFDQQNIDHRLQPPSSEHLFGTDEFGRDIYSRVLYGARYSMAMGLGATALALLIGVPAGLISGYARGAVDEMIMRGLDLLLSFPPIILGMVILALTSPSLTKTILAVGVVYVPVVARVTRSVTLSLAEEQFVAAARARGESATYIVLREILPNAWPPIIVEGSLRITFAILLGAGLSFLGLGPQPPAPDWGLMINEARSYISIAPWMALAPGFAMSITLVAFNLLGDGLREMLDPRIRREGIAGGVAL